MTLSDEQRQWRRCGRSAVSTTSWRRTSSTIRQNREETKEIMGKNAGKSVEECVAEREAELALQKHLTDPADLKRSRQRVAHLGNRIAKLNGLAGRG